MTFEEKINSYEEYVEKLEENDRNRILERAREFLIYQNDLSTEVERQAAIYSYIANRVAIQQARRNAAKIEEKVVKAKSRLEIKKNPPIDKMTVDDLSALVEMNAEVLQACAAHNYEQMLLDQLEADRDAAKQKGDMLKLLAMDVRRELTTKSGY